MRADRQPVSNRLHGAMGLVRRKTMPQRLLGQPIDCRLKRWEALTHFSKYGFLEVDNRKIKNSFRPGTLGTRYWIFIGLPEAGDRSAVIYTLLGSCWRPGNNSFECLKNLIARLPAAKINEIQQFTIAACAKTEERQAFPPGA